MTETMTEQEFSQAVATRLRELRERKGLTREAVASGADVSVRAYYTWEAAEKLPTGASLLKLANFHGLTPAGLIK